MHSRSQLHTFGYAFLLFFIVFQSHVLYTQQWSLFQNINLIFHEAGHTLFLWAPHFIMVLMGSGFEVLLPVLVTLYFYHRRQTLGWYFGLWWTGTALWSVGLYAGDGLDRSLALIGNLDQTYHDWYYLLLETKLLYQAETIGNVIYFVGSICIITSIGLLGYRIYSKIVK